MSSEPAKQANDSELKPPIANSGDGGLSPKISPRISASKGESCDLFPVLSCFVRWLPLYLILQLLFRDGWAVVCVACFAFSLHC